MKQIAIVSAKRTPIGKYKGKLRNYSAVIQVIQILIRRDSVFHATYG